ncbi:MAG: hypothetical protein ABJP70_05810 [Erythrobacter sp.]
MAQDQNAQTPEEEVDPVVEAYTQMKARSEAGAAAYNEQKAQIEAQTAAVLARFPSSDTTGADGTASAEGGGYYANHLAHKAMNAAASQMAARIGSVSGIGKYDVFLVNGIDLPAATAQWRQINSQLDNLQKAIDALLGIAPDAGGVSALSNDESPGALAFASAAPQILGGLVDIAAFFRSNVTSEGVTVSLAEEELVASLIAHMPPGVSVSYPTISLRGKTGLTERMTRLIRTDALLRERKEAIIRAAAAAIKPTEDKRDDTIRKIAKEEAKDPKDTPKIAGLKNQLERFNALIALTKELTASEGEAIDTLRTNVAEVIKALNTPNEAGVTPLQATDAVAIMVASGNAALLEVNVASSGGERQIKTSPFGSGRVSYLGGVNASFRLTDELGRVLATGSWSALEQESMSRGNFFGRNTSSVSLVPAPTVPAEEGAGQ